MEELYYREEHRVFMRECDRFRRMKPSAMLTLFQDASEALTERWGVGLGAMIKQGAIWVAAKLSYDVTRLPIHEEEIVVRSWAGRGLMTVCPFYCRIEDNAGNIMVDGVSLWVLADMESRSMMNSKLPKIQLPSPLPEDERLPLLPSVRRPDSWETSVRRVMFSETDINQHLTNTRYLDWMTDLTNSGFHREHPLKGISMEYREEIGPDEEVELRWSISDGRLWCEAPGKFMGELRF